MKKIFISKLEVPGIKKEDINISIEDNIITIKGEKKVNDDKKDKINNQK